LNSDEIKIKVKKGNLAGVDRLKLRICPMK
jgi:hypothetical protein